MVSGFRSWLLMRDPITQRENTDQSCSTRPNLWFTSWNITAVLRALIFPISRPRSLSFASAACHSFSLLRPNLIEFDCAAALFCTDLQINWLTPGAQSSLTAPADSMLDARIFIFISCRVLYFAGPVTDILNTCEQNMLHNYLYCFAMSTAIFLTLKSSLNMGCDFQFEKYIEFKFKNINVIGFTM